jgi:hypothetical protein
MGSLYSVSSTDGSITTAGAITSTSTTKGFQPPSMTTTQRNAIPTPADGLIVYDTTLHQLWEYQNGAWAEVGGGGGGSGVVLQSLQFISTTQTTSTVADTLIPTTTTGTITLSNIAHRVKVTVVGILDDKAAVTVFRDNTTNLGQGPMFDGYNIISIEGASITTGSSFAFIDTPGELNPTYTVYFTNYTGSPTNWGSIGATYILLEELTA